MLKQKFIAAAAIAASFMLSIPSSTLAFGKKPKRQVSFTVRVENISDKEGLTAADGSKYPFAISPGVYSASDGQVEFFKLGKKASKALEAQAEDGSPEMLLNLSSVMGGAGYYGAFNLPVGASMPSPILPDGAYEFTFTATKGMKFNLITMFGQSNDLFYAPSRSIELFDAKGEPISGDITGKFELWDAGTEVNQAPGIGPDQGPRQSMKNVGAAEKGVVRIVKDEFSYPNTKEVLKITITASDSNEAIKRVSSPQSQVVSGK